VGEGNRPENLDGNALRVRVAARVRIAVRCGVFKNLRVLSSVIVGLLSRVGNKFQDMNQSMILSTNEPRDSFDLMPYFASVEYSEGVLHALFGGDRQLVEPTALSNN